MQLSCDKADLTVVLSLRQVLPILLVHVYNITMEKCKKIAFLGAKFNRQMFINHLISCKCILITLYMYFKNTFTIMYGKVALHFQSPK